MKAILSIVKVKGSVKWAQKAALNGEIRYRGFMYKKEAIDNLGEWISINDTGMFERDFYHNFHTADELKITEI